MSKRISFLLTTFFLLTSSAQSNVSYTDSVTSLPVFYLLSVSDRPYDLAEFLRVFEDSSGALTIEQVSSHEFAHRFHANKFNRKPWQNQSYQVWARITIINETGNSQHCFLSGGFGDSIICYKQTGIQSFESRITGKRVPLLHQGNTLIQHADFEYFIDPDDSVTFFFRLSQDNFEWLPNQVPLKLYTFPAIVQFQQQSRINWLLNGLYFGMALLMLVYALALWIIFHERAYLWLALFQLSNLLYFLDQTGIGFQVLYPGNTFLFKYGNPLFLWGIVFWHFMFVASYLKIRKTFPHLYYALLFITLTAAFIRLFFWTFGYYQLGRYLEDFAILAMILSLFAVVFYMAFGHKNRLAKIMILGEISVVIAGIISGLTYTQLIIFPSNYAMNILQAGFTLQMILWTVAIVDKIILLRKEKDRSQARELEMAYANEQLIRDQNILLEKKVEERTLKLKEAQSHLIQSEKMASLGMLSAGIAHEINNPINFINAGAISLQKDYDDLKLFIQSLGEVSAESQNIAREIGMDELLKIIPQTIDDIRTGVHRTSEIVQGLRNFTKIDDSEMLETDIHEGMDSTLLLLSHKIKDRIRIVKEYDAHIASIRCYPGLLNQVFMNLLNNGIDAIDQKLASGQYAEVTSQGGPQIGIATQLVEERGKSHLRIMITDNGIGVPDEIRNKLFDPFFTTKEIGKGTGLGLAICHGIIEKHGGTITFESTVNEGSSFTITLPVV